MTFDRNQNLRSIQDAFRAAREGKIYESDDFDTNTSVPQILVTFERPIDDYSIGHILIFQEELFKFTDEFFEVVSSVPFGEGILIAFNSDVYSDKIRTKISDMLNCSKFANICSSLGIFNIVFEESVYKPGNVLNHGSTPPPNYKIISKMNCADALDLPKPERSDKPVILVAAAALIDPEGRILIAQRPEGKNMAGLWEFPGGKVDAGETPEYALMRELEEELGIETRPCCFSPIAFASEEYEAFHLLMPLFVCRIWRGIPKALEHAALKWVKPADLYSYPMPPADLPLIAALRDRL